MKINPEIKTGPFQNKAAAKKTDKKPADQVLIGGGKEADFLAMGDKLKGIKSAEGGFLSALKGEVEDPVRESEIKTTGKITGAGIGLVAGAAGTFLLSGMGVLGAAGGAVIGGAGGYILGNQIGKAAARLTWAGTKEKIMEDLVKAEESSVDAKGDFEFIKKHKTEEKTLKEATGEFLSILNRVGSGKTTEAQDIFGELSKTADDRQRAEETSLLFDIISREDKVTDGLEDFKFIKENKNKDKYLTEATEDFKEILGVTGTKHSGAAREIFAKLDKIKPDERGEAKEVMFILIKAENSPAEALRNFEFIEKNKNKEKPLREAAKEFNEILGKTGNEETKAARKIFENLEKITDTEQRKFEKEAIFGLVKAEDNAGEAVENFDFIKESKSDDASLKGALREFHEALEITGKENTGEARELFLKGQDEKGVLSFLINATGDESDGNSILNLVKENKKEDVTLMSTAREFNGILQKVGRRNSYEAKKIFTMLSQIEDEKQKETEETVLYEVIGKSYNLGEGIDNFNFIKANKKDDETLKETADEYGATLEKVGRRNSYEAKKIFTMLRQIEDEKQKETEETVLYEVIGKSYNLGEGIDNFNFIKANKKDDETLKETADEYGATLEKVGRRNSYEAKKIFTMLRQIEDKQQKETEETVLYEVIGKSYNLGEGIDNFNFIKANKKDDETLKETADEYGATLEKVGRRNSYEAKKIFTMLRQIEDKQQKEMEEALLYEVIGKSYNLGEGIDNFNFIKANKKDDETLKETADEYGAILEKVGRRNSYEAKKIFNILIEIDDEKQKEMEQGVLYSVIDSAYNLGDGIDNFNYIKANKGEEKPLEEAAKEFNVILEKLGKRNSYEARKLFGEYCKAEKEILPLLIDAENEKEQGIENFQFIKEHKNEEQSIKDAATDFNEILKKVGNNNTDEAREIFAELEKAGTPEEIKEHKEMIFSHMDAENEFLQGVDNFKLIKAHKPEGQTLKEASDDFLTILEAGGNGDTDETRAIYKEFAAIQDPQDRNSAKNDIVEIFENIGKGNVKEGKIIFAELQEVSDQEEKEIEKELIFQQAKAENEIDQGVDNFKLIKANKPEGQTLKEASDDFLAILKAGGNGDTDETRAIYRELAAIQDPKERSTAVNDIVEIFGDIGKGNVKEAKMIFAELQKVSDPKQKQEEKELMLQQIKGENAIEQGIDNFKIIKANKPEGQTMKEASDDFLAILKAGGNDDTDETRAIYREFAKIQDPKERDAARKDIAEIFTHIGKGNVKEAKMFFAELQKTADPKQKKLEKELIFQHIKAENGIDQGIENFRFIKANKPEGQTIKDASNDFLKILAKVGNNSTDDARSEYLKHCKQ
jgi:hypothetical protein